jgi:hypothetical protein
MKTRIDQVIEVNDAVYLIPTRKRRGTKLIIIPSTSKPPKRGTYIGKVQPPGSPDTLFFLDIGS